MKKFARAIWKTVKWTFIVFFLFSFSLLFRDQRLPNALVTWLGKRLSTKSEVVHFESISIGLPSGVNLQGLRVFDPRSARSLEPLFSAKAVCVRPFARHVTVVEAKFPRLPAGQPGGGGPSQSQAMERLRSDGFSRLPDFDLELVRPAILGVVADRLDAHVACGWRQLKLADIRLDWPDSERRIGLKGECIVDLDAARLYGDVKGTVRQANIRPLLEVLDVPIALPYVDAFGGVTEPVPASCGWNVSLADFAFSIDMRFSPTLGRYQGVPMKDADSRILVRVSLGPDGECRYETTVGPLVAHDRRDGELSGHITFDNATGPDRITVDAASSLGKQDVLDIVGYLNDGALDVLTCETPPSQTVMGTLFPGAADIGKNDLFGAVAFEKGALFGAPLRDASCRWRFLGDKVVVSDATAVGPRGGKISGGVELTGVTYEKGPSAFRFFATLESGHLGEFGDLSKIDFGRRDGELAGRIELEGPISDAPLAPQLDGKGSIVIRNGHLAQMKLFLGLTEMLAEYVPGVSAVVNQSQASADFTITSGVIRSENIRLEGSLFSIHAAGSYDIVKDDLDFDVQVKFLKDENILGKYLIRPIFWTFSKLLLEYRVKGKIEEPKWEYVSLLDRVM